MGLQDILNGMQNGPRGQRQPSSGGSGGGMSPITMALLGLLAYKALKGGALGNIFGGAQPAAPGNAARPAGVPPGPLEAGNSGGGLGGLLGGLFGGRSATPADGRPGGAMSDMLPGGLGNLLGGAAAGSVLSSGLGNLIKDLQTSGHGQAGQSWVDKGPNREIAPNQLADALGSDTLDALSQQTGMGRQDLLTGLSQQLPTLVDELTPNGRLPTEEEASRLV
jgi:uncharacterized protein YidB (DUF937 family)